ncbi:MAG: cellulase family glycosylhydrolase [Flavobacterium sp.]|jgi:endoglucanase|nr:cellulase family glycosylhydrolase [Flavobacterium sp.]HQV36467.1 cellulase family glycosylhydrolase [Flavobacterium sp.]HRZ32502.1 cellulase family glycosylhydrolase [Flavobacterium sp.]
MKKTLFIALLLLCPLMIYSQNKNDFSENTPVLKTNGKQLIDPLGKPILLNGTNLGNWLVPEGYMFKFEQVNSPRKIDEFLYEMIGPDSLEVFWDKYLDNYITNDDIKYLKQIGCNHLRIPFHYKMFTQDLYMGKRNAGFIYLDKVIEWCRQENLYVLLDMHCAPGGQTGDNIDDSYGYPYLFFSKKSQDLLSDIWVDIAKKYKNDPIVIGYDLINEPLAHYFKDEIKDYNLRLHLLYKRLVADIRKIDKKHTLFLSGSLWGGNFGVFEEILDNNVVYEFHKYWFDVNQESVQFYVDFSEKHDVPIYIGETGENTDEWIRDFRILLDKNKINWCFWPYKKMNNPRGIMNFDQPENFNLLIDFAKSDRSSFENIRKNRPNPELVQKALNQYLENCHFNKGNFENSGYLEGLGYKNHKIKKR